MCSEIHPVHSSEKPSAQLACARRGYIAEQGIFHSMTRKARSVVCTVEPQANKELLKALKRTGS
eukprot:scaffold99515_cov31-Tisochrysis_lutea.AAC.3